MTRSWGRGGVDIEQRDLRLESAVGWLRLSYRAGAVVDGFAVIGMLFPKLFWPARFAKPFDRGSAELAYGMREGAPLMAGWTLLLLWADRRPLERKGVLAITAAGVVGLMAHDVVAVRSGQIAARSVIPTRVLQASLFGLFLVSWARATVAEARTPVQ